MGSLWIALVLLADAGVTTVPKITARNWEHHPQVEAARAVFTEVRAALDARTLATRATADCTQEFSELTLATDRQAVVRYLFRSFGGSDSSQSVEAFYDAKGTLRFVFVKVGAVPSAWVEARYWLDETGALVWKSRTTGGEGPTYYANDPAEYLVKNPLAFFEKRARCSQQR
jgi:hypothetical protein